LRPWNAKVTEALFKRERASRFANYRADRASQLCASSPRPQAGEGWGRRWIRAGSIEDLRVPPGNRLEALKGNRKGQWSIRINDQWRVCFRFKDGNVLDVEIVDYH